MPYRYGVPATKATKRETKSAVILAAECLAMLNEQSGTFWHQFLKIGLSIRSVEVAQSSTHCFGESQTERVKGDSKKVFGFRSNLKTRPDKAKRYNWCKVSLELAGLEVLLCGVGTVVMVIDRLQRNVFNTHCR